MVKASAAALLLLASTGCELLVNDGARSLASGDASSQEASSGENLPRTPTQTAPGWVDAGTGKAGEDASSMGAAVVVAAVDGSYEVFATDATTGFADALDTADTGSGEDAAAAIDAAQAAPDASCSPDERAACIDTASACAQTCGASAMTCVSQCASHACEKRCPQQESACRATCTQACVSCEASSGCSIMDTSACSTATAPKAQNQ